MGKTVLILVWNGPWIGSLNCTSAAASNSWHVSCFHVAAIYIYIVHTLWCSSSQLFSLCAPPTPGRTFSCPQRYFDSFESGLMKHVFGVLEECRLNRECLQARNALKYKKAYFPSFFLYSASVCMRVPPRALKFPPLVQKALRELHWCL